MIPFYLFPQKARRRSLSNIFSLLAWYKPLVDLVYTNCHYYNYKNHHLF
jgi:hypothetical protein